MFAFSVLGIACHQGLTVEEELACERQKLSDLDTAHSALEARAFKLEADIRRLRGATPPNGSIVLFALLGGLVLLGASSVVALTVVRQRGDARQPLR